MLRHVLLSIAFLLIFGCSAEKNLAGKIDDALIRSHEQYAILVKNTAQGRYPKTYHVKKDSVETSDSGWWCSGFFPGTLLYLNEERPSAELKKKAIEVLSDLKKEQFNTSTHDLGFMMYCSFGNAQRLDPKTEYEEILMNSAKSLSTRFNEKAGCIQSWDPAPWNGAGKDEMPVIIDNMMNLELLFWATKHTGDSTYYKIAVRHADTTIKNHFRPDYSSYHVVVYGKEDGKMHRQITNQGAADASAWARGQSWGLYGYTLMYHETKDPKYLEQAQHIADFLLNHPNFPKDMIPYWDYNAPNLPNALRDSSAASIMASALLGLSQYSNAEKSAGYQKASEQILTTLLSAEYLAEAGTNGGFILKHGVGNMPNKTEIDTPLSYGDYYFIEALMRYKKLKNL